MTENVFWGTADKELHVFGVYAEIYLSDAHAFGVSVNFLEHCFQEFTSVYSFHFCMEAYFRHEKINK